MKSFKIDHSMSFALALAFATSNYPLNAAPATGLNTAGQLSQVSGLSSKSFAFAHLENGVQIRANGQTKNILFYGPTIVRVNANLGESHTNQPSLAVVKSPAKVAFKITESPAALRISSAALHILVDKKTGALTFLRPDGTLFTRERTEQPTEIKEVSISEAPTYEVKHNLTLMKDESLYGLGQYNQRYMDYRGQNVLMVQTNIGSVIPFLVSTRRYGIMWDIYSKMTFKDDASGATLWAESAPAGVDYYFFAGNNMDEVIAGYRQLTGAAPMFPKAAYGLFMSKERYATQDRLVDVVRNFRKERFPLDYIVQDWQYWGGDKDGTWSGMIWNPERYPNPRAMTKTLHDELHVKLMNSIWPSVGNDTELAKELDSKGLRFEPLHWISRKARIYDAFSPEGRAIYFKHIKKGLLDVGVDALWMDGTEVEVGGACHNPAEVERDIKGLGKNAMGDFTRYLNPYTLMTTKGTYEGQRATSNKRAFTLTRSAWAGQQHYAAVPWSGDTTASWNTFRNQISGGVNVAMAGQPYWTQDTGGFFVNYAGGQNNPEYRELYARWNQFAIFNPIYRIHGTSIEREPYIFKTLDPATYQSLLEAANLRYRLLPYIYSLGWASTSQSYTMMRGLPMDFPDDVQARKIDDQFMFGPAFLVHPVTRPMYQVPNSPAPTVPAEAFTTLDGQPGLAVQYFSGTNFERPAGTAIDSKIDATWPGPPLTELPPGLQSLDHFSARWTGFLTMPEDGEYEIGADSDDGVRIYLDNKLVIDDWRFRAKAWNSKKMTFRKGQKVELKVEYNQDRFDRVMRLGWWTPSQIAAGANRAKADNIAETYLPTGANWFDFWTNERHTGGASVKKVSQLDQIPLFVRAGSIVPMGPVQQYATEKLDAPYEIRVYPGANARFVIYEDDNETYNYEKGQRATVELIWNDAAKTLTFNPRVGSFSGMVKTRQMQVVLASPNQNQSSGADKSFTKSITYTGKREVVKF